MTELSSFKISISDAEIEDLKNRLSRTRWPDKETPDDWSQGIPLSYMKEIRDYWLHDYNWRERESLLNRFPQFKITLNDLGIHFLHIQSPCKTARPLLLTHGWPGSIVEFQKVIPLLSDPASNGGSEEDAFHLICPSLPGFGFSDRPTKPGWHIKKIASAWNDLMTQLGYRQYFAQGGDWGSMITTEIGIQNLGNCRGIHINMPLVSPDPKTLKQPTELEKQALSAMKYYQNHDSGYSKQQSTRPQTLGYGLSDSPIGQAAWILEKFYQWMDCQGRPENAVSRDELLDNVMIYWWTNSAASSARIYWESVNATDLNSTISIPSGISVFPKEIFKTSERWAKKRFTDLRHFNVLNKGGHFAAFEQPEFFVEEIRTCFAKMDI